MKTGILLSILAIALALASTSSEAGQRGHNAHHRSHGPAHHGYVTPRARHRYGRRHHPHRHHRDGYHSLAGAILMGTIVATLNQPRPAGIVVTGPAYAVRNPYRVKQNVWYQRDSNGECFEVRLQHGGTQLWTRTHPRQCR